MLIAGPCQTESLEHSLNIAQNINDICQRLQIGFIYKSSFDKANRSNVSAKRGLGLEKTLPIFAEIKKRFNCQYNAIEPDKVQRLKLAKNKNIKTKFLEVVFLIDTNIHLIEVA